MFTDGNIYEGSLLLSTYLPSRSASDFRVMRWRDEQVEHTG